METASTHLPSKPSLRSSPGASPGSAPSPTGPTLTPPDGGTSPPLVLSSHSSSSLDRRIGGLSTDQGRLKVLRFWRKKHEFQAADTKVKYSKRKKVADKKLRINGKFVSQKQAINVLGMTKRQF